jgi:NRPS condensation-like uncharacterized protein
MNSTKPKSLNAKKLKERNKTMNETVLRRLGTFERFYWLSDQVCTTNFNVHGAIKGKITDDNLKEALACLKKKYIFLNVIIQRKNRAGIYFVHADTPHIPLRTCNKPETEWIGEVEKDLHKNFNREEGVLMRCLLIRHRDDNATIVITLDHIITDGLSSIYLLKDLMEILGKITNGEAVEEFNRVHLSDPLEKRFPPGTKGIVGSLRFLKQAAASMIKESGTGQPIMPSKDGQATFKNRKVFIVSRVLDSKFINALVEKTRNNNTTVYAVLNAAYIIAIAEDSNILKDSPFQISADIDMRNKVRPVIGQAIGVYTSIIGVFVSAHKNKNIWTLAQEFRDGLLSGLYKKEHYILFGRFLALIDRIISLFGASSKTVEKYTQIYGALMGDGGLNTCNLGVVDIPAQYGNISIKNIGFADSLSIYVLMQLVVSTFNGVMRLNGIGMEPVYSRQHCEKIVDRTIEIVRYAVL